MVKNGMQLRNGHIRLDTSIGEKIRKLSAIQEYKELQPLHIGQY